MADSAKEGGILAVIAKNLLEIRRAKGMAQEQLAFVSGVGREYIQACEQGDGE